MSERFQDIVNPEPISLTIPELHSIAVATFTIEYIKRKERIVFHLTANVPVKDDEIKYKIIPKKIIHALYPVIPKHIKINITFVPELNSWAIYSDDLAQDPFRDWICSRIIEALKREFTVDLNKVPAILK